MSEWWTSTEAARHLGVHRDTTRRAAASGLVPGAHQEPRPGSIQAPWVATREAWETWYANRRPAGRPRREREEDAGMTTWQAWLGDILMGEGATRDEAIEAAVREYEAQGGYGEYPLLRSREKLISRLDVSTCPGEEGGIGRPRL